MPTNNINEEKGDKIPLYGALDRLAPNIGWPSLSWDGAKREVRAVNSEFSGAKQDDDCRQQGTALAYAHVCKLT